MQLSVVDFPLDNDLLTKEFREQVAASKLKTSGSDEENGRRAESDDLEKLRIALAEHNITLKFRKDEKTKVMIVEMIDDQTGEEIRQFPTEVSLKLAANFVRLQGQFVNETK